MTPFRAAPADDPSHAVLAPRAGGEFSDWLDALAGPDPDRRRLAATSPGALVDGLGEDGAELPDAAVSALLRQVAVETDPAVRQAICTQLARHDQLEVVDGLVEHLAGHDAGLRTAAVDVHLLAKTPADLAALKTAVEAACQFQRGMVAGYTVAAIGAPSVGSLETDSGKLLWYLPLSFPLTYRR